MRPLYSHLNEAQGGPFANDTSESKSVVCLGQLGKYFEAFSQDQIDRTYALASDLQDEDGTYLDINAAVTPENQYPDRGCDLLPVVLDATEWSHLEAGLAQRARAWNHFLQDIYLDQRILKDEIVSYETVYSDPNFHRGCSRLPFNPESYLRFAGFDLQQDARGRWMVCEDHIGSAVGASYAMKKRTILRHVAPRLFDFQEILPNEDFTTQLLDALHEMVEQRPHVVLLSQGSADLHYLDHAALARQMGVPIVQGSDLIVLDGRLYLKTIAGVDRVDVVLRRLPTSLLDPVTFDGSSRFGVAGLLSCVRKGTVAVANGLGSDLANNRALATQMPEIIEYYLGEKPILAGITTHEMRDIDLREMVRDKPDSFTLLHATRRGAAYEWKLNDLEEKDLADLWKKVEQTPSDYVARKIVEGQKHLCRTEAGLTKSPVTLRTFCLGGERISPCVLGWSGSSNELSSSSSSKLLTTSKVKDVWILRSHAATPILVRLVEEEDPRRSRLTSRVAECLFWMGRYTERAEATVRALRYMQSLPWPAPATPQVQVRFPLWSALAVLIGQSSTFFIKPGPFTPSPARLPFYLLLDRKNPGSVLSCLRSCRQNADNIREHLPPEAWTVLNRLYTQQSDHADEAQSPITQQALEDRTIHNEIITQLDELTGAVEKHMVHNDTWHFWQLGMAAERSVLTIQSMQQVLTRRNGPPGPPSTLDPNLDSLLQIVAGQYAYRSLYHARPLAYKVAELLLKDEEFPRSALFCVNTMSRALERTVGERFAKSGDAPLRQCQKIAAELNFMDISGYFTRVEEPGKEAVLGNLPGPLFNEKLTQLTAQFLEFNTLISDHYLDHQVLLREPELFDGQKV